MCDNNSSIKIMYLKFKKLNHRALIPSYSVKGDAGLDLTSTSLDKSNPLYWEYGTGLSVEIPLGCVGLLFARSSISKTEHSLRNSVGVLDSGYRGEIKLRMTTPSTSASTAGYSVGDRIGQLIVFEIPRIKIVEEEELSATVRGGGGFGSTGE